MRKLLESKRKLVIEIKAEKLSLYTLAFTYLYKSTFIINAYLKMGGRKQLQLSDNSRM
jgi:hypothetical protein